MGDDVGLAGILPRVVGPVGQERSDQDVVNASQKGRQPTALVGFVRPRLAEAGLSTERALGVALIVCNWTPLPRASFYSQEKGGYCCVRENR